MKTIYLTHNAGSDLILECELEYDPGESPNYDLESPTCGPGWPAEAILVSAKLDGIEILPILADHVVQKIEESVL